MKKIFSLLFVALLVMPAWADTVVTLDFSAQGYENSQQIHELTIDGVAVTFDKGTNTNNPPAYFNTGTAIRLYPGNSMTVSAGQNLKKIDFTFGSGDNSNNILCDVGSYNNAGKQWTIGSSDPSTSVVFSIDGTSGHRRIKQLVVTMEEADPVLELVPPVFEPNGGEFSGSQAVTLSCATQNAQIYWFYGTEEDQGVHNFYNGPIYLTETSTLTAYSVKGDDMSEYVTVTFTKVEQTVEAPVFTPASCSFSDRLDVALTCSTPNAKIYYSLDNELWNEYVDPIPVTSDLTIWAKAKVGDVESQVVSATYTKLPETTVTVNFDPSVDTGDGSTTRGHYTVVKDQVTMYVGDGTVYPDNYRVYGPNDSSAFVFTSSGAPILRIELSSGTASQTPSNLSLPEGQSGTYTTSGHDGVWEGNAQEVSFKVNAQVRLYTVIVTLAGEEPSTLRGDVNGDKDVDITDATALINYLLYGDATGIVLANADCDGEEGVDISDATALINYLLYSTWDVATPAN